MAFFCILWAPLFYMFRRSLGTNSGSGGVWALLLGSIIAIVQFFFGDIINPGGFGLSRWISAFVDIVSLPVILPMLVYLLFLVFRITSSDSIDFAGFTLLWLIPAAGLRAIGWGSENDPVVLVLVPLLWTALAVGISFFIELILHYMRWYVIILAGICILLLPLLASTAWWAFYSQKNFYGYIFLSAAFVPTIISIILLYKKAGPGK